MLHRERTHITLVELQCGLRESFLELEILQLVRDQVRERAVGHECRAAGLEQERLASLAFSASSAAR